MNNSQVTPPRALLMNVNTVGFVLAINAQGAPFQA